MRGAVLITTAALAALLGGCASTAANRKPRLADATLAARGVECHTERPTGTLIGATVCTTPAERERQAGNTQQTKDWMGKPNAGPCPPNVKCN